MEEKATSDGKKPADRKKFSRRDFLITGSAAVAVDTLIPERSAAAAPAAPPAAGKVSWSKAQGYIVYDSHKCAGCTTCMLACSLTHHGGESLSLARLQIIQDSWGKFPYDLKVAPCRQCVTPVCVENCPVGAAFVDSANGNVRRIDEKKCVGCKTCIRMCPQVPHRPVWNRYSKKSQKCDLCIDTPYWDEKGGPGGKQACVESCPMKALKFVAATPEQSETDGYNVNLRNVHWINLGLVDDSRIVPPVMVEDARRRKVAAKKPAAKKA